MTSIREQIMVQVFDAVAGVTSFKSVQRLAGDVKLLAKLPSVGVQASSGIKAAGPQSGSGGFETETINVSVGIFVDPTAAPTAGFAPLIDAEVTKIERVLLVDRNWTALAIDTRVTGWSLFDPEEGQEFIGAEVRAEIDYRHLYGEPEAQQ